MEHTHSTCVEIVHRTTGNSYLSEGETLGVAEADFCSVGFGSLILGKKISITEYLAVLCHKK